MEVIDIRISRYKDVITGIKIAEGADWLMISSVVGDYLLDGVKIINKRYIKSIDVIPQTDITYKILKLKYEPPERVVSYQSLSTSLGLFRELRERGDLIAMQLHTEGAIVVGRVLSLNRQSFVMETIDTEARIDDVHTFRFDKIRDIGLHNDYLDSLDTYMNKIQNSVS